jgi:hypothetical protein
VCASLGSGLDPVIAEDIGDGATSNLMSQIPQCASDSRVPRSVQKLKLAIGNCISEHQPMSWRPGNFVELLVAGMGCWIGRQAEARIEYLKAENRLLRSRLGRRRDLFSDAERRALATLAKEIGTEALRALDPLVSPATLLRWHRQLVAQKCTLLQGQRPGRPRTKIDVEQLVVRMARENPGWDYTRIHGAISTSSWTGHDSTHPEGPSNRARTGPRPTYSMVGVSEGALKSDRGQRLLYR